jgi:hypothetical protein
MTTHAEIVSTLVGELKAAITDQATLTRVFALLDRLEGGYKAMNTEEKQRCTTSEAAFNNLLLNGGLQLDALTQEQVRLKALVDRANPFSFNPNLHYDAIMTEMAKKGLLKLNKADLAKRR